MKKHTILLITLLLFILLFNGLSAKDARTELTHSLEKVDEKITLFEADLIHKENLINELERQLQSKNSLLDELQRQVNKLHWENGRNTTKRSNTVNELEKMIELPAVIRPNEAILTR
ncbi:hypothetical protein GMD78_16550 [Ornithinibacillus sp. L9]|uniref:Uncharacterized protein n=1 Tax=Ornithinibacillus caprae TaxID=2678566 RepID=A0A6N8FKS9_9BACI|nr:hypothetical protein [Ornithinibacillus caprae]MUK89983.1 hypothetical protein [Ornithinibacillus caprae]